jgi:diguanylate cyclase (GGDEF)-like protein/PAS domain S-box-containing protein
MEVTMNESVLKILLIEDNRGDAELIRQMALSFEENFAIKTSDRLSTGLKALSEEAFDIVLLDLGLPDSTGIDTLRKLQKKVPELPVVVLTGLTDEDLAIKAIGLGAQDYLVKGRIDRALLIRSMRYAVERKRFGEALRRSEEFNRAAMANMGEGLFTLDYQLRVTYVNPAAERLFGWSSAELLARTIHDIVHYQHPDGTAFPDKDCPVLEVLQSGAVLIEHEDTFIRKDGAFFPVVYSSSPIRSGGEITGLVVVFRDITVKKRAEVALRESEEKFRNLFNNSEVAMFRSKLDGSETLDINQKFLDIVGRTRAETQGKPSLMLWADPREREEMVRRLAADGRVTEFEFKILNKQGGIRNCLTSLVLYREQGILEGSIRDITDRKQAEEKVKESRERFKNLVEASSDWVWEVDEHSVYTYASPKVRDILGYEPEEVLGKTPFDLMPPEEAARCSDIFWDSAASKKPFSLLENVNIHKNGSRVVLETSGVPFFDNAGSLKGYRGIDRDINDRKRAEDTIRYQACHDLLTGLPNRALFANLLDHEILEMERLRKRLAVLFLDVDQFKNINDSFGHSAGDRLIQHIGAELKNSIREFDTVARIGGDEFTLLLPLINRPEDASRIADKVMQTFNKPFIIDHHEIRLTASIGICLYPEDGRDAGVLLKNADIALHFAKDQGRDNYQFYNSSISHRTLERVIFENRLRQAVEREEMVVHYQPQRNIKTGKITGAEALVRWNHPDLGMLKPARFIPLAEETGLIIEIDQWVLRTVCKQLKAWEAAGHALPFVTTNLSARQFQQTALAGIIGEILENTALRPENLGIEITETLAMRDTELTSRNLSQLNAMGVKLLIDDFGTGYSSLSYLKKLPIHKLKIDKSFIADLAKDRDDQAITNAIVAMAHILKLKVVAEGVETKGQETLLESQGCDEMQGFLFSRPVPAGEFEKLLVSVAGNGDLET